jgi:hypothetical protein
MAWEKRPRSLISPKKGQKKTPYYTYFIKLIEISIVWVNKKRNSAQEQE